MRLTLLAATSLLVLTACQQQAESPADDTNIVANEVTVDANAATPAASIHETSWEYTRDGKSMQLSIDATGNYVIQSGTEHIDHGTAEMKDGKLCFTTAMEANKGKDGCWTEAKADVGQSAETTSDQGEKLTVTRVAYVPMTT